MIAVQRNEEIHPVDVAAQFRELYAAPDINDFVEISGGDSVEFLIDVFDIIHDIAVHVSGRSAHENHRDDDKTQKEDQGVEYDPFI